MNHRSIREACCEANRRLPATGLVDLTFGNVSVIDRAAGVLAIKPSGVDYADLTPERMVIVDLEGNVVEGTLRPSSDTPTHRKLFLAFPGIGSVVHTHSRNAVAFAQALRPIPCLGTTHADHFRGEVPVTRHMTPEEISGDYEWETGKVIVEAFAERDPLEVPGVLVAGHGPFAWGPDASKAVEYALALEICAEIALKTLALNPSVGELPVALREKHFLRKHGKDAYYGQT
ncbi:MAG: ribulose 5-phosphate epimerase [Verrucomicrobiota bacterium]